MDKNTTKKKNPRKLNVALQGGGSHGAFTWGVLDALLEQDDLNIEGISATSAGSMNAVVLTQGLMTGGIQGARQHLHDFWHKVSTCGSAFAPMEQITENMPFKSMWNMIPSMWNSPDNPAIQALSLMAQNMSPYQFNPMNINPLRDILDDMVDFEKIRTFKNVSLYITATNVRTGNPRIFTSTELTRDMVLASAALPNVYQAEEIDGEFYWDGGFMGNPSLWPLYYDTKVLDLLIVHVNPMVRHKIPKDPIAIEERLNEITFNAALLKELRAISFVQKLLHKDMLKDEYKDKYRDIRLHAIRTEDSLAAFELGTKFDTSWTFLTSLKNAGRKSAQNWLATNKDAIGKHATVNIDNAYLGLTPPLKTEKEKA